MREFSSWLIEELGSTEPLWMLYAALHRAWMRSALYYSTERLMDGRGLTGLRHDHMNRSLQDICDRYPGWFPAFNYDRRRSSVFALIERDGFALSAFIARSRADWQDAAALRVDVNRQTSLWNPPTLRARRETLVATLMVLNGSPRARVIREAPREVLVRFIVGDKCYDGEELSLDKMFAARLKQQHQQPPQRIVVPKPTIIVPSAPMPIVAKDTPRHGVDVKREQISKKRRARVKPTLIDKPASPPVGFDPA